MRTKRIKGCVFDKRDSTDYSRSQPLDNLGESVSKVFVCLLVAHFFILIQVDYKYVDIGYNN